MNLNRQLLLSLLLAAAIASGFWAFSRYPSLLGKFAAGSAVHIDQGLSFTALLEVPKDAPLIERVGRSTINWINTNKQGMTFGVIFGAAVLTLFSFMPPITSKRPFINAVTGALLGAPLGVCANCVAPIGKGLYHAGLAAETVIATIISSPSFNIVVLAMLFSLFPLPIALLKVGLTLLFVLVFVPLLAAPYSRRTKKTTVIHAAPATPAWPQAARAVGGAYLTNLGFIAIRTVPLMLVAGLLGAVVMEVIPAELVQRLPVAPLTIVLVAIIGTFLPTPIAFDVVAAYTLYAAGAPLALVAALLTTLGPYSIYTASIVGTSISWRLAGYIYGGIVALGMAAAYLAESALLTSIDSTMIYTSLAVMSVIFGAGGLWYNIVILVSQRSSRIK